MRFKQLFLEEYIPTPKEIKRFNDVNNGFGEVVKYEDLVDELKEFNKTTKFPIHGQLNFILKQSKDLYELKSNMKRFLKDLKEEQRYKIEKILNKY